MVYTVQLPSLMTGSQEPLVHTPLRLSVVSWATLEQQVPPLGQGLVKGQVTSGWTMSAVPGGRLVWLHAASMVGESITVLTGRTQGLSVQVSTRQLAMFELFSDSANQQLFAFIFYLVMYRHSS